MSTWYTVTHEYDGHAERRWVVRRHAKTFIRSFMYRRNAESHVTDVLKGRIGMPDPINNTYEPAPWRYDGTYHEPLIIAGIAHSDKPVRIEVGFPNEDPDTEDDRVLIFTFTEEGLIIDGMVGEQPTCTSSETYEELYDRLLSISEEYG